MNKVLLLTALALLSAAEGARRTLVPARVGSLDIPRDSEAFPRMGWKRISQEWVYSARVKGTPDQPFFQRECRNAVLEILKSPASAKFSKPTGTSYNLQGGFYTTAGTVDSANSYGALLRRDYICFSVFEGNDKGGVVYFKADLIGDG